MHVHMQFLSICISSPHMSITGGSLPARSMLSVTPPSTCSPRQSAADVTMSAPADVTSHMTPSKHISRSHSQSPGELKHSIHSTGEQTTLV